MRKHRRPFAEPGAAGDHPAAFLEAVVVGRGIILNSAFSADVLVRESQVVVVGAAFTNHEVRARGSFLDGPPTTSSTPFALYTLRHTEAAQGATPFGAPEGVRAAHTQGAPEGVPEAVQDAVAAWESP